MLVGQAAHSGPVGGQLLASRGGQFFASAEGLVGPVAWALKFGVGEWLHVNDFHVLRWRVRRVRLAAWPSWYRSTSKGGLALEERVEFGGGEGLHLGDFHVLTDAYGFAHADERGGETWGGAGELNGALGLRWQGV